MSTHTPGPWAVFGKAGYTGHKVGDCTARSIAAFPATSKRCEDERNANARLIAAAPDLLKELKWVAGRIDRNSGSPNFTSDEYDRIVAAIAKAEGRS